jgi:ABC-type uncharacterized transport system permease subunit
MDIRDHGGGVLGGVRGQGGGVSPDSLGFAAVALAVLADSSPVSVVAVAQQLLWNR